MKLIFVLMTVLLLNGCTWFERVPSGARSIEGSIIYEDFSAIKDANCSADCPKSDVVIYRLKAGGRGLLAEVPSQILVKAFFDHRKPIPYEGQFKGQVIYNSMNRVDYLRIDSINDQAISVEVKATDIN